MSKNLLLSYVEEYILNPAQSRKLNIDDDGNEETVAVCDDKIEGKSPKESFASISKLRQKNAQLLGEVDPRYRGKKASRKSMSKKEELSYDPELAKFCVIEDDEDEDEDDGDDDSETSEVEKEDFEITNVSDYNEKNSDSKSMEEDFMRMADDEDDDDNDDDDELSDEGENEEESDGSEDDDGDDNDLLDESNGYKNNNILDNVEDEDSVEEPSTRIQTFTKKKSGEIPKGIAVKNQCFIYDKLFEVRIGLQKVASISNQLPQFDKYKSFLENADYPLYREKLLIARKETKKLLMEIFKLQETILKGNQETAAIVESEESESEEDNEKDIEKKEPRGTKRKLEKFEEILRKRHKNMLPFRDETLNRWHEKSKLLMNQKSNFGKFEISPAIQIKNILANKEDLVKKTRLIGVSRGNVYKILGKDDAKEENTKLEEYDSEIFDDSDFYSRLLEDFLKSKISVSDNMTEVSMHWVGIQKLRNKSKRKVEANASKGRKLRHQVITKQQNFMAPCKYSLMSDEATNKLFSSLFGGSCK